MPRFRTTLIPLALFLLALAVRLPGLDVFFTADEFLWVDRSRNFLGGLLDPDFECLLPSETKTNAVPIRGYALYGRGSKLHDVKLFDAAW